VPTDWYLHVCDVCRLLDGDTRAKMSFYCPICDAWICEHDADNWQRRARAGAIAISQRFA
jgi:hypothetical protein